MEKLICFICKANLRFAVGKSDDFPKQNEIYKKGLCKSCLFSLFPSLEV